MQEALKSEKERGWNIRRQALASEQDSLISSDWRASRPPTVPVPNGKQQVPWRQRHESSTSNPSSRQLYVNPFAHAPAEVMVSSSGASDCDSNDLGPLSAGKYLVDIEVCILEYQSFFGFFFSTCLFNHCYVAKCPAEPFEQLVRYFIHKSYSCLLHMFGVLKLMEPLIVQSFHVIL